tara:strand:- start:9 stop:1682 length:1674 start_codon:yes stop_codon:yes gene_type:complete
MSKISRKKLARGTKLTTNHVYQPLTDIGDSISITSDRMENKNGTFRLNLSIPVINDGVSKTKTDYHITPQKDMRAALCVPFTLVPLQVYFDNGLGRKYARESTPQLTLEEISVSFDTRAESAAIRNKLDANLDYGSVNKTSINISIVEKPISVDYMIPTREVESIKIDHIWMENNVDRQNPFILDNLGTPIDPYSAHLIKIEADDLHVIGGSSPDQLRIISFHLSLKFKHPIVGRTGHTVLQNAPILAGGATETISITTPAADSVIMADASGGVQNEIKKIDDLFINKLKGGLYKDGSDGQYKHLRSDSSYEVIAVPMWGNFGEHQIVTSTNVDQAMYYDGSSLPEYVCDRRLIPINYPLIIHHVIATTNYTDVFCGGSSSTQNSIPTLPGAHFFHQVGVGIGRGLRADDLGYQEIAYLEFSPHAAPTATNPIDRMVSHRNSSMNLSVCEFETWNIPIHSTGVNGIGFGTQGQPYYVGKSTSATNARTNVGDPLNPGTGIAPNTAGGEQWIEIRWALMSTTGLRDVSVNELYVGSGGNWVYLICQKPLVGGKGDMEI